MVFQFEHVELDHGADKWDVRPLRLTDLKKSFGRWQLGLADVGWNSLYWDNHDAPRAVSRFGDDGEFRERSATMLATVLHLQRGTPYVYQGEELGMTGAHFERIDQYRDIESLNHFAEALEHGRATEESLLEALRASSRDNSRTPVQWDATENAGFTTGEPWIAVNPNYPEINAAEQHDNPSSVFHFYRSLITLRHAEPAVALGDFTMLMPDDEAVYAFLRRHGQTELLVLGNFSTEPRPVLISDTAAWTGAQLVLCNIDSGAVTDDSSLPELQPWEARVYRRQVG
jgi:oligo-1,6-glucosidase